MIATFYIFIKMAIIKIITVKAGYNEPVYTENSLYRTKVTRTDFFIVNYTGYNELI